MELPPSYSFSCKLCNYKTKHRRYLIKHKKKMHPVSLNKKYSCTLCNVRFERVTLFQSHIKYKLCRKKVQESYLSNGDDQSQSQSGSPGASVLDGDGVTYLSAQPEVNILNSSNRTIIDDGAAGDFESEEGLSLPIVCFDGRMSSEMETGKIRSPDNSPNQIVDEEVEWNDSEFELNMQDRPASRMSLFTNSEKPQCSVIQSEPILVWNTSVVPSINVERLKTDEDTKLIAKWLLKTDLKQNKTVTNEDSTNVNNPLSTINENENNYCDNVVTNEDSANEINPQSTTNKSENNYKRFKCSQCDKLYCLKRTLAAHVKYFHQNPFSFKCDLCHRVFNTQVLLSRHITHIHNSNPKIKCISCNVTFKHQREVQLHKPRCLKAQKIESNSLRSAGNTEEAVTTTISKPATNDELELSICVESEAVPSTLEFPVVYKKRRRKAKRLSFYSVKKKPVVKGSKTTTSPKSLLFTGENEMSTTATATVAERLKDETGTHCPVCGAKCISAAAVVAHLKRHKKEI